MVFLNLPTPTLFRFAGLGLVPVSGGLSGAGCGQAAVGNNDGNMVMMMMMMLLMMMMMIMIMMMMTTMMMLLLFCLFTFLILQYAQENKLM